MTASALGEDGPTHQPVEHLAVLRAIPNLAVLPPRRCDGDRRVLGAGAEAHRRPDRCWRSRGRTCRRCARDAGENLGARGAYVLADAEGGPRDVTLIATGSEVALAMAARERWQAEGIAGRRRLACPAGSSSPRRTRPTARRCCGTGRASPSRPGRLRLGPLAGAEGIFVGMGGFGASAPADELFRHFGITPAKVAEAARRLTG